MRILVSNDDGINAPGLWTLVRELSQVGEVVVAAPDREQSGVGTSLTLHQPLRVTEVAPQVPGVKAFAVEGTPGDCIIFALRAEEGKFDVLFSGINEGSNLGNDVLISGTVGAAFQGHFYGLPSVALSVTAMQDVRFDVAARMGGVIARGIADGLVHRDMFLNVNVPNIPLEKIKGVQVTRLAGRSYTDLIKEGHDGKRRYYWIVRGKAEWSEEEGTDVSAIRQDKVSITPLQSDLTGFSRLQLVDALCPGFMEGLRQYSPAPAK